MARAQPIEIAGVPFSKKSAALSYMRGILTKYHPEEMISKVDARFMAKALENHPDASEKIGLGVKSIFVRRADYGTKCFWVERLDGAEVKFSYKYCASKTN